MSPPRRALGGGHPTGVFIGEALHPYNVFKAAGFEVDIASENGVWYEDWLSLQPGFLSDEERKQHDDKGSESRRGMDSRIKAGDLVGWDYGIFFASAGHAALIDYPHATNLKKIAAKVWHDGGIPIVEGKKFAGFTTQAEEEMGIMDALRSWKEPLIDEHSKVLGAEYVRPKGVWDDFHVTDGRIVTGANPQRAKSTAEEIVKVFEAL
ncbi:class I glutamine amidotransferase-like protein [Setomelanomma holmii]|uniref:D-lactate dehydratase n=1 Tax=Setomelanomma holmii TaxID=210430 RepID=A0A9P4H578_9PLEO|nr:class I glutamine amidotransferase-like protein [Setomelanomma holmii]